MIGGEQLQVPRWKDDIKPNIRHRKYSIPAALQPRERKESTTRRRFSNVSDAVSRKLSTTIGWKTASVSEVIQQAKSLCNQYIRTRLKRCGLLNKKLGLQRLSSLANIPGGFILCEVYHELNIIGLELEKMHPKLYTSVCRQVCVTLTSDKVLRNVFLNIAAEMFKSDVNWGMIVSLFAVAGGLAVDCVRQGHPDYLPALIETTGSIVERYLASWIANQGGWRALLERYKAPTDSNSLESIVVAVLLLILFALALIGMLKYVGKMLLQT